MSKSTRNIFLFIFVYTLVHNISSCSAPANSFHDHKIYNRVSTSVQSAYIKEVDSLIETQSAVDHESVPMKDNPAESAPSSGIAALDAAFEAAVPEPSGSTASMHAYAEAYRDFWQSEADKLAAANPKLAAEYELFEAELSRELEAYAETFKSGDYAPYGSAVGYEVTYRRGELLRDFVAERIDGE